MEFLGDYEIFPNLSQLSNITVSSENPYFASVDGILYSKDLKTVIRCPEDKEGEIKFAEQADTIGKFAFFGLRRANPLVIGKQFKTIGIGAFNGIYSGEIQILNPACEIAGGNGNERVTIAGYDKSTAQAFAEKYGFQFRLIGEKNPFGDVKSDSWQLKAANYCLEKNLMAGKGKLEDGSIKFDPDMNMTRAEFAQVLYNMEGKPPVEYDGHFPDVEDGKWYTNAITWAYQNNIVSGTGKGTFNVTGMINRQEMATMLKKYAAFKNFDVDSRAELSAFKDADSISPWAVENMKWAIAKNIMKGKGDVIDALGKATRAECAAMLKNFCDTFGQ